MLKQDCRMMRILIHINSLGYGGAEKVVSILSGYLAKKGHEVILATEWAEEREYPLPEGVRRIHVGLEGEGTAVCAGAPARSCADDGADAAGGNGTAGSCTSAGVSSAANITPVPPGSAAYDESSASCVGPSGDGGFMAGKSNGKHGRFRNAYIRLKRLREAIAEEQPDLVLSFVKKANYRAAFALLGSRIPLVVSVRNDPAVDYAGLKNFFSNQIMVQKAAGCVFQTSQAQRFFGEAFAKRSRVILNPVEERFLQADWEGPGENAAPVIVSVGRITAQKNQLLLVQAFEKLLRNAKLKPGSPAAHSEQDGAGRSEGIAAADPARSLLPQLHLYGAADPEGETYRQLTRYIETNGLTDAVTIHPPTAHVEEVLKKASFFVLSSDYEGLPNALLEAMVMGVPCISTDCPCGGPAEVIKSGWNGLLTPVGDAGAMSAAMERLLTDPEYAAKLGSEAKQLRSRVSPETVCAEWEEYLLQVR